MNSVKEIDAKNWASYFFGDRINVKNLDPNKIKLNEKSYKNILIYYVGYVTPNSAKLLKLIINKVNGYIEESNGNKYITLVPANESKGTLK